MSSWRYTIDGTDVGPVDRHRMRSADGTILSLSGPNDASTIDRDRPDLTRYIPLLPIARKSLSTLGAGMTPLVAGTLEGRGVWFKLDSMLPTGSFKDRGAAVVVAMLKDSGVRRVVVDSSGNAAASMSAYAAVAGIACTVFAPASASVAKLVQSRAYGADVQLVDGSRDAVSDAAFDAASADLSTIYSSHNMSALFAEGVKTWALETWEQRGYSVPDRVFVPAGGGSAVLGAFRGFAATGTLPEIVACQPASCSPIVSAFQSGADHIEPASPEHTIAEGARIANPPRGNLILDLLRENGGDAIALAEPELQEALQTLWRQGIYAEPTAALGAAGFIKAVRRGDAVGGDNVILITGTGLKATETIQHLIEAVLPPSS